MVIVLATTQVKEGRRTVFIALFKNFAEKVRQETGCIEYFPSIDLQTDILPVTPAPNELTIIEKWESMEALQEHLKTAEMKSFGEKTKDMTISMSAKVLQPA